MQSSDAASAPRGLIRSAAKTLVRSMNVILVVNAGSSSLKFQLFHVDGSTDLRLVIQGQFEGVGTRPRLKAHDSAGATLIDEAFSPEKARTWPRPLN